MSERKTLIESARDWGQVILIGCAIGGGAVTFSARAWGWVNAGPEAKREAAAVSTRVEKIERDMRRLKRRSRFATKAMEKISGLKYDYAREDRDVLSVEDDE